MYALQELAQFINHEVNDSVKNLSSERPEVSVAEMYPNLENQNSLLSLQTILFDNGAILAAKSVVITPLTSQMGVEGIPEYENFSNACNFGTLEVGMFFTDGNGSKAYLKIGARKAININSGEVIKLLPSWSIQPLSGTVLIGRAVLLSTQGKNEEENGEPMPMAIEQFADVPSDLSKEDLNRAVSSDETQSSDFALVTGKVRKNKTAKVKIKVVNKGKKAKTKVKTDSKKGKKSKGEHK